MTAISKKTRILFVILAWITVFPSEAFAYLDPGTGSLLVQTLVAALAAAGYALKLYWSRIRLFFRRPADRNDSPEAPPFTEA